MATYHFNIFKGKNGRWYKPCSECNELQSYLRKNYALESYKLKKTCKKCSNKKTENCHRGWNKGIRLSWFNKFKVSAETRGIKFLLSIDDVAEIYKTQNGKCALTGWNIVFPETGHPQQADASLDRIDSSKHYETGNVQIVHKMVNMMKQRYSQDDFIKVCKAVASKW